MRSSLGFLAFLNLLTLVLIACPADAVQDEDGGVMTVNGDVRDNEKCESAGCNTLVSTTGSGATLSYGCTYNSTTGVCTGTCYRCDGQNPNSRTEICVKVTGSDKCTPDSVDAQFTCGTGYAYSCTATDATDGKSCCSQIQLTPPTTGGSCAGVTCVKDE
jgi:hypothetical protein